MEKNADKLNRSKCNDRDTIIIIIIKAITSNVSTSIKWHSTIIFPGDIGQRTERGRLIGKCFLRAMRAKHGLKEAMGVNW